MPWTPNVRIPDQQSKSSPALAEFRGELHMVHAGNSSNDIWHSVSPDGETWSRNERIRGQQSKAPAALASFQDRLHITHLGNSSNRIWHSSFDGIRWTTNDEIEGELSQAAPAMAVFQGGLHLLHLGTRIRTEFLDQSLLQFGVAGQRLRASPGSVQCRAKCVTPGWSPRTAAR